MRTQFLSTCLLICAVLYATALPQEPANLSSSVSDTSALLQSFPKEIRITSLKSRQIIHLNKVNPIITGTLTNVTEIEPNDDPNQAQVLNSPSPIIVSGNAEVTDVGGIEVNFGDGTKDDLEDLFLITTQSAGLSLNLTGISSDLDIYLLRINGGIITEVGKSNMSGIVEENIVQPALPAGTYYIAVSIYDLAPIGPNSSAYTLTVTSFAAPIADFTGNPTTGVKPLLVQFTDASNGQITSRSWNFGDGQNSTAINPSHTYTNAGTYTVALTATGPGGSNTKTRTNYITVTEPPQILNPPTNLQASLIGKQVTLTWDPPSSITGTIALLQSFPKEIRLTSRMPQQSARLNKVNPIITGTLDNITEIEPNDNPNQAQVLEGSSPVIISGNAEVTDVGEINITFLDGSNDDLEDLFIVNTQSAGLSLNLTGITSDLDIYLFQISGSSITMVDTSLHVGIVNESIEQPILPAGIYYVGVSIYDPYPIGPNSSPYTLTVTGDFGGEVEGLVNYNIYRSTSPNAATSGTVIGNTLPGTTSFFDNISGLSGERFYYQLTAVYDAGESEPSNEVFVENMAAPEVPVQLSPANNAVNQQTTLTLNWNPSTGAETYHLQVSASSNFTTTVVNDASLTTSSKEIGSLSNNTTYYWRVNANNQGGASDWSEIWNFKTIISLPAQVQLQSPPDNSTNQSINLTLNWNPSTGAETYHLQVSTQSNFETAIINDAITTTSELVGPFHNNTTYYWRVNAQNGGGTSEWSEIWNFKTMVSLPNQAQLQSPPDNATIGSDTVHFIWHQCTPEITRYWFEIAENSAMTNSVIDSMLTVEDTTKTITHLLNSQNYWWRVKAKNTAGWGPFSIPRKFSVVITDVDITGNFPREFSLSQNHPNPFNPSTRIRYSIPKASFVTLKVYDIIGIEVATLVNEEKSVGNYEVVFNGNNLSSGVYFYRIQTGDFTDTKKFVLVK